MSSSKGGSSQAEDVEVTRQDQDMISAYGKLNNKLAELKRIRSSKEVRGCNPSHSLFLSTLSLRHYLAPRMGTGIGESCEAPLVSAMSWRSFFSGNLIFEESNFFFLLLLTWLPLCVGIHHLHRGKRRSSRKSRMNCSRVMTMSCKAFFFYILLLLLLLLLLF